MAEKTIPNLGGVSETLLIPLYLRAVESWRPDGLIKDETAMAIVENLDCDFSRFRLQNHDKVGLIMRTREFDRRACEFLSRNQQAVIVHIGCGLDTRFERVDNGFVEWFDLDLPEVIDLRQKLFLSVNRGQVNRVSERYHLLADSVFETTWMEQVRAISRRPVLFLAEGVLPYFETAQVKSLVLSLRQHFPGSELVCDASTPFVIWSDNLQLASSKIHARLRWGLKRGKDVESWGEGITMLDEWFYFDRPEPRMEAYRWMRFFPLLGKSTGIFHYRLGSLP